MKKGVSKALSFFWKDVFDPRQVEKIRAHGGQINYIFLGSVLAMWLTALIIHRFGLIQSLWPIHLIALYLVLVSVGDRLFVRYFARSQNRVVFSEFVIRFLHYVGIVSFIYFTGGLNSPFLFLLAAHAFADMILSHVVYGSFSFFCGISLSGLMLLFQFLGWLPLVLPYPQETPVPYEILFSFYTYNLLIGLVFLIILLTGGLAVAFSTWQVRQREMELESANRVLGQLAKARAQFISAASHDIRAPLTGVLGFSELMLMGKAGSLTEQQKRYINTIHTSGKHLLEIIEDLLDISRIDAEQLKLSLQEYNVAEGITSAYGALKPLFDSKQIEVEINIDPAIPFVKADPVRVNQMLINYLSNAMKFTPDKGKVTISALQEGKFVKIEVRDTGVGISAEDQAHLFERFFQSERTKYGVKGTGLGLSIVKQLVELHGGKVGVESKIGHGATFWFTLRVYT